MDMKQPKSRKPRKKVPLSKRLVRPRRTKERARHKAIKAVETEFTVKTESFKSPEPGLSNLIRPGPSGFYEYGSSDAAYKGSSDLPKCLSPTIPQHLLSVLPEERQFFTNFCLSSVKQESVDLPETASEVVGVNCPLDSEDSPYEDPKPSEGDCVMPEPAESPFTLRWSGKRLVQDKITIRVIVENDHEIALRGTGSDLNLKGYPIIASTSSLTRPEQEFSLNGSPEVAFDVDHEVPLADASTVQPPAEEVSEEEIQKRLAERVQSFLPPNWTLQVYPEFVYALLTTMPPYRVTRAVCVSFKGEISVEVDGKTLPKTHEIYSDPMVQCPGTLSYETIESFATAIKRAAYAVQSYKKCVGVEADNAVEEWTNHPICRLDDQGTDGQKVLRTRECSLLLSKHRKRCVLCNQYEDALKKREARRRLHTSGKVDENIPHSHLTPLQLKSVLKAKQSIIRRQALQLKRMRERVDKMTGAEAVDVDDKLADDLSDVSENADGLVNPRGNN